MRTLAALTIALLATLGPTVMAQDDPCAGQTLSEDEIGLNYDGYCVAADLDGPSVQPLIVSVTEDLGGTHALGILIVRTADGWEIAEPAFYVADAEDMDVGDETVGGE